MNKCPNCGTEFEGRFCPECGKSVSNEKLCPNCKALVPSGAKFCKECGFSLIPQVLPTVAAPAVPAASAPPAEQTADAPSQIKIASPKWLYYLKFAPALLLTLFSAICLLCYFAPYAMISGGGLIPDISLGNLYDLLGKPSSSQLGASELDAGLPILILVLTLCSLLFSLIAAIAAVRSGKKKRYVLIAAKPYPIPELIALFGATACYLALFACGCTAMAKIANAGRIDGLTESVTLFKAGACPILLLVFAPLFLGLSAISVFLEYKGWKKYIYLKRKKEDPDLAPPKLPQEISRGPIARNFSQWITRLYFYRTFAFFIFGLSLIPLVYAVTPICIAAFETNTFFTAPSWIMDMALYSSTVKGMLISVLFYMASCGTIFALIYLSVRFWWKSYLHYPFEKFRNLTVSYQNPHSFVVGIVLYIIIFLVPTIVLLSFQQMTDRLSEAGFTLLTPIPVVVLLTSLIIDDAYFGRVVRRTLLLLYGTKKVTKTTPQTEAADKFREACLTYETQLKEYFAATSIQKTS